MNEIKLTQLIIDGENSNLKRLCEMYIVYSRQSNVRRRYLKDCINNSVPLASLQRYELVYGDATFTTALCVACDVSHSDVVSNLLENGADVNVTADLKFSPIHFACDSTRDSFKKVQLLLSCDKDLLHVVSGYKTTALHHAAATGHLGVVTLLLRHGTDVNVKDVTGDAPIHIAAVEEHKDVVATLIQSNAEINTRNNQGQTALHIASRIGNVSMVNLLLSQGADIRSRDTRGDPPVHYAVYGGRKDAVGVLLDHQADVNDLNSSKETALHIAANLGHIDIMTVLIKHGADINAQDESGWSSLIHCSQTGNTSAMVELLTQGANVNTPDIHGRAPILYAAKGGHCDAINLLLKHGASVNTADLLHLAPLHVAAEFDHTDATETLILNGGNVNVRDKFGLTPLHFAARNDSISALRILMKHGADMKAKDDTGKLPLHTAAFHGHAEVIRFFIVNDVDVNSIGAFDRTPVYAAVQNNHEEAVVTLLDMGARINVTDSDKAATPVHLAAELGHAHLIQILKHRGADIRAKTKEGDLAIHRAASNGHVNVVEQMLNFKINVNEKNHAGSTSMHLASECGHISVLEALLRHKADVFKQDDNENRPIHVAALSGQKEVLALFLNHGVSVNTRGNYQRTPLHMVAEKNTADCADMLLQQSADVNAVDEHGFTALYVASALGNVAVMKILLENNADINIRSKSGNLPIHIAFLRGHLAAGNFLLDYGINTADEWLLSTGECNRTCLYLAVEGRSEECTRSLIKRGVNVNQRDSHGCTPLHSSAFIGDFEIVRLLLQHGADMCIKNNELTLPIHLAASEGHLTVLELFLNYGMDIDARGRQNFTPLFYAVVKGHEKCVEMLLRRHAMVNLRDESSITPLMHAACTQPLPMIDTLLAYGAEVDTRDITGGSPLMYAASNKDVKVLKRVLDQGITINTRLKYYKNTLLFTAVSYNTPENIKVLYKHGANVEERGVCGSTAVHFAAEYGYNDCLIALLECGANIEATDKILRSPLHIASNYGHTDIIKTLLNAGADPNTTDVDGNTALHLASTAGDLGAVRVLVSCSSLDFLLRNRGGYTAVELAKQNNHDTVARELLKQAYSGGKFKEDKIPQDQRTTRDFSKQQFEQGVSSSLTATTGYQPPMQLKGEAMLSDVVITLGRIRTKRDEEHVAFVQYNFSSFFKQYLRNHETVDQLESAVHALDEKIAIRSTSSEYKTIVDDVRCIINNLFEEFLRKQMIFKSAKPICTGSLYSNLKVGLPLEADFLCEVDISDSTSANYETFCTHISEIVKDKSIFRNTCNDHTWILHAVSEYRVCICLVMECRQKSGRNSSYGFTVDLVPAAKLAAEVKEKVKFSEKAKVFLKDIGLMDDNYANLHSLLSLSRDYIYDTGVLVNQIMQTLDYRIQVGFRAAKYLLQNGVFSDIPQYGNSVDSEKSVAMFGYDPLVKSFHLRMCLLHLIIQTHGCSIASKLTSSAVTLCLLDMVHTSFDCFATYSTNVRVSKGKQTMNSFRDPIIDDDSLHFTYKLDWSGRSFEYLARQVKDVMDTFKRDSLTCEISRYKLMNCH